MKISILLPLLALMSAGFANHARAEDHRVDGSQGCLEIGGEWQSGAVCLVHHLVVGADDTLVVASGVHLVSDGAIYNYGRVETLGTFRPAAPVLNRGTLITEGLTVNENVMTNSGTWVNRGWIHTHGGIGNYGVFENEGSGYIETCSGPIFNYAYMHNAADIDNWGTLIANEGIFVNDGRFYNPEGDNYRIENAGAFENRGLVENGSADSGSTFLNLCGAAFYGDGTVLGTPVQYERCTPAAAIQLLMSRVYEVPLTKKDIRALTDHLGKAAKYLSLYNDRASAAAEVRSFVDEVDTLLSAGTLADYLGAAFVGWVERILVLLAT